MERLGRHGRRLKELRRRVRSRRDGEVVVDGRRLIEDLVRWDFRLRELYVGSGLVGREDVRLLAAAADGAWVVENDLLVEISPTRSPQGLLAVVDEPHWGPWETTEGCLVLLDGVQEPGNVGAIVRSAAALGAGAVMLSPGCSDPLHWASVRASGGAVFKLPVAVGVDARAAAARVRERGGEVWNAQTGGVTVSDWRPHEPVLLVLGSEGRGISSSVAGLADGTVSIPLERGLESLNVAVAAGILLQALRHSC